MSGSMHLPGELRDQTLRALADVLGFDFWALDEVAKEDAARALVEALGLQISASGGLEDEIASNDYDEQIEELQDDLKAAEEKLADAEETIVELREFREDACAMFGVKTTGKTATEEEVDRPIGDVLDDLSDARQKLESRAETAELEFREFFVNVCILFNVATTEPVGEGIEVNRLTDDVLYDLGIVRQGLEGAKARAGAYWDLRCSTYQALGLDAKRNDKASLDAAKGSEVSLDGFSPKESVDALVAAMGLMDVAEIVGLPRSATGADVAQAVRDLAERCRALEARTENLQPSETADVLAAALDERAQIVNALGLDLRSTGKDIVRYVRELVERYEALLVTNKIKPGPLRGVL